MICALSENVQENTADSNDRTFQNFQDDMKNDFVELQRSQIMNSRREIDGHPQRVNPIFREILFCFHLFVTLATLFFCCL